MKHLATVLLLLAFLVLPVSSPAQTKGAWIPTTPRGEVFRIRMPRPLKMSAAAGRYEKVAVSGNNYSAVAGGVTYSIFSLKVLTDTSGFDEVDDYIDVCAELTWESLLKPLRDGLSKDDQANARMTFHNIAADENFVDREYFIKLGNRDGIVHLYDSQDRLYVLLVLNAQAGFAGAKTFFNSFNPDIHVTYGRLPVVASLELDPAITSDMHEFPPPKLEPQARHIDYNKRVFRASDTTQKAEVLYRPEPSYTESARKFGVEGMVVLDAILTKEGLVDIFPRDGLPHGLTQAAIAAAKRIRFRPATRDGRLVSQYLKIEYKFSLN
jgi:TonB family protein